MSLATTHKPPKIGANHGDQTPDLKMDIENRRKDILKRRYTIDLAIHNDGIILGRIKLVSSHLLLLFLLVRTSGFSGAQKTIQKKNVSKK